MNRIVCLGNRSEESDSAGPLVYDQLAEREFPNSVEVVNGGLPDLNLLELVETSERVIFVDTVTGIGEPGEVLLIEDVSQLLHRTDRPERGDGLGYLLTMLEAVDGSAPEILVVGLEPPHTQTALWRAVEMSILAATREAKPSGQIHFIKKDLIA